MANLIIPAAGAFVGSFFGPYGAAIGWSLGSMVVSSQQEIEQPKLGDMRIQTSQYGNIIPMIVGRQRISGNIGWSSKKREYEIKDRAGKGGPTTISTGYHIDLCIMLCEGPILGISRVWANEQIIVNPGSALPGQIYLGGIDQMPDPTMEAYEGAGNVPAYRGIAYIMIENYDLGVSGIVPQFSFEVVKSGGV